MIKSKWGTRVVKGSMLAMAAAAAMQVLVGGGGVVRGDVLIGHDWTPAPNSNGFTYYDGFTNYSGNPLAQVDAATNPRLQIDITNAYWGQTSGQMWANNAISTANFNANPRLEFDMDISQWHWGNLDYKVEIGNDSPTGNQGGQGGPNVIAQLGYLTVPRPLANGNPIVQHISVDLSSLLPRSEAATFVDFLQYFEPRYWGYWDDAAQMWRDTGNSYTAQRVIIDNFRLTSDPAKVNGSWNVDADGSWNTDANWAGQTNGTGAGVAPNGAGHTANFSPVRHVYALPNGWTDTAAIGSRTVTVDSPVTVGVLNFYNTNSMTVAGPSAITMQGAVGVPAAINVAAGSHTISAPLTLSGDTSIDVSNAASTLTLLNLGSSSATLTKKGAGKLAVSNVRAGGLNIAGGTVEVAPNGTSAGASNIGNLSIAVAAKFDLKDNKLLTNTAAGTAVSGVYSGVQGEVQRAYNFGAWDQPGLMTSMPDAGPLVGTTTVGVATAEQVLFLAPTETGTFAGQPVTGATTIAVYTYAGDLNFDGLVDAADYGVIDNWVQFPGTDGYANGDFNYDGVIDAGDYGIIDNTIQLQGAPIPMGSAAAAGLGSGVTAVPEPAAASVIVLAAASAAMRRRRRLR